MSETEAFGTATNNTIFTAKTIASSLFTSPNPATVFAGLGPTATVLGTGGGSDVDFYSFSALGGTVDIDIDNARYTFDTILSLFDSNGVLLAFNDDSFADTGSEDPLDSYLGTFVLPTAGVYYIAVAEFNNFASQSFNGTLTSLVAPNGDFGGDAVSGVPADSSFRENGTDQGLQYTMHISLSNPAPAVPEPTTFAMLAGAVGMLPFCRRLRKSKAA